MYKDKIVLITGGTGSWGHELTRQLLPKEPKEIRIYSRNELAQVNMSRYFNNPKLKFIIGDVRDGEALENAARGVDIIFHLAALKHVPVCEEQPQEAVKTNITGTVNLINAAVRNHVEKVIDVSSDKAVEPLNLYGMTKAVGEKLIIQANMLDVSTRFVCIRAGNVLGSNGSVVPYFMDQIRRFNKVSVTCAEMTRFFLTLPDAIQLLFKAAENCLGGETFVMKMPSCRILDLAKVLIDESRSRDAAIEFTGIRPGEKVDEVLLSQYESCNSFVYDDNYFLILPVLKIEKLNEYYDKNKLGRVCFKEYTSRDELLNLSGIREILAKGGFIP